MALKESIRRLAARQASRGDRPVAPAKQKIDDEPGCVYGIVVRETLSALEEDLGRLETKLNGVVFGIVVTFALEVYKSFVG